MMMIMYTIVLIFGIICLLCILWMMMNRDLDLGSWTRSVRISPITIPPPSFSPSSSLPPPRLEDIEGNTVSSHVQSVLANLEQKTNKTPLDLYQIGSVYDYHYGNPILAEQYYQQSIEQIRSTTLKPSYFPQSLLRRQEDHMVLDRIQNRIDINDWKEYDEFHETLPHLVQLQRDIDATKQSFHRLRYTQWKEEKETKTKKDEEEKKKDQKKQEPKREVEWKIDTQNVHDHFLNEEMVKQIEIISKENEQFNRTIPSVSTIKQRLSSSLSTNDQLDYTSKLSHAYLMLDKIVEHDQGLVKLHGKTEGWFLGHLWARIESQPNRTELSKMFIQNLHDSWNHGKPVCVTGRITRALSSFAHLDSNPSIGQLLTKEIIRNEILEKAGKIRDEVVKTFSAVDQALYLSSTTSPPSPRILAIDEKIKLELSTMIDKEYPFLDFDTRTKIKSEVLSF